MPERESDVRTGARRVLGALAVAACVLAALPPAALGTYPGENGRILIAADADPNPAVSNIDIIAVDPNGQNLVNLTNTPSLYESGPSFSGDGRLIGFDRSPDGSDGDLWTMSADGQNQVNVTATPGVGEAGGSLSPDGSRFVYSLDVTPGPGATFDIWAINTDGQNNVPLHQSPGFDISASFSPDGSRIVWAESGDDEILIMNSDGQNKGAVTDTPTEFERHPSFAPDGRIVFSRGSFSQRDAFIINQDGQGEQPLLRTPSDEDATIVSPDARQLAYTSNTDGDLDNDTVFVAGFDGSNPTPIFKSDEISGNIAWGIVPKDCQGLPATIRGTEAAETLRGTPGVDVIAAGLGNDKIKSLQGADVVCGDGGNDKISGGTGNDLLSGGQGKDRLLGSKGKDNLKGGSGKDQCVGAAGKDKASSCEKERSV